MTEFDYMQQQLPVCTENPPEVREKARRAVALGVPKEDVAEILDMLGLK